MLLAAFPVAMKKDDLVVTLNIHEFRQMMVELIDERLAKARPAQEPDKENTQLISRLDVCNIFGVSKTTLDKWRRYGVLPKEVKIASRVYFKRDQIEELIRTQQKNRKPL
jgi:predicted DNA-binding transcriptional regulator AlpA